MRLVYSKTKQEVKIGDKIEYVHHNDPCDTIPTTLTITYIERPKHGGSTGRVYASEDGRAVGLGYFPSVYGMEWIEREDQQ